MKNIEIYTDGACKGNPGPGGWCAIIRYNGNEKEISGGEEQTTNNRMEMTAVIEGLRVLKEPCCVTLYSDSKYVCDSIEKGWAQRWQLNGWIRNNKEPVLNSDLWLEINKLCDYHEIKVVWIKGHEGHKENERCDFVAVRESEKFSEEKLKMNRFIYADNAATTAISKEVFEAMEPYIKKHYGNPSSLYSLSRVTKDAVEASREKVAKALGAETSEIFFTSGGSESDNWALKGICKELKSKNKNHIITTAFEHHAVLNTVKELEKEGFRVDYLNVHENGIISLEELENLISEDTAIVSIMYANNEIGTIQPIEQIGEICRSKKVIFHTDAVQAVGNVHIDVKKQNIDLLSLSAHKFHGPKGVGALYIKNGIKIKNLIEGGAQERGRRAGTENVAGIVGLGVAIENAVSKMDEKNAKLKKMQDRLIDFLLSIEKTRLNGDRKKRLAGNINVCFEGIEGESLLLKLDLLGVCASSGSACTSGSLDPSHVLLAIGLPHEIAHGSLRISFGDENSMEDVEYIEKVIPGVVKTLRDMSPLWEKIKKKEEVK